MMGDSPSDLTTTSGRASVGASNGRWATIAAAFLISIPLGVTTSLAVIVHEVPEELGDYALLRAAGVTKRRALCALAGVRR